MIIRFPKKQSDTFLLDHIKATLLWTFPLLIFCYFFIDLSLAKFFASMASPLLKTTAQALTHLIDPKFQVFLWPVLYFFLRFIYKKESLGHWCLLFLTSIAIANVFTEILKKVIGRARPSAFFSLGQYGLTFFSTSDLYSSFPSGHACTIGAICGVLACRYPRCWIPLLALSFLLASTRVILNFHYLSDIIAGSILGFLVAQWIYKLMKKERMI